jgi:hypothetical protein
LDLDATVVLSSDVVDGFEEVYYANGYDDIVSLADFYALGTTVAIRNAVQESI